MSINHQNINPYQQQNFYPQYQNPINQMQHNANTMIWVQGIEGAKAYLVAPGMTIPLWDSENQSVYLKSTDQSGVPKPLTILDYTIRAAEDPVDTNSAAIDTSSFATKDDISDLSAAISQMSNSISDLAIELKVIKEQRRGGYSSNQNTNKKGAVERHE